MSVIGSNIIAGASGVVVDTGYQIERSLRFNSADSANLQWTPPQAGNRRTWTWSGWVKRSALGSVQGIFEGFSSSNNISSLHFTSGDAISFQDVSGASYNLIWTSAAVWRDVGAWYHITFVYDATQASSANAAKLYVNGVQQTLNFTAATGSYSQNRDTWVNSVISHRHGLYNNASYINGYITEVNFIDGQALTPSDFGETSTTTGVWTPKAYAGTYGQNGFYLPFNDNSTVLNLGRNRQTLTADPYFPVTTLLLNGNGTNGAQNNTFLDSSTNNFTITRNGNTTQGTFSPFSQTGWSNYFSSSSNLTIADNAAFNLSTGAWTMEAFVFPTSVSSRQVILGKRVASGGFTISWYLEITSTGQVQFTNGTAGYASSANVVLPNVWGHVVAVYDGTNLSLYYNGTRVLAPTAITNNDSTASIFVGGSSIDSFFFTGHISNARIVKGTAVYSGATITVPTAPLTAISGTSLLTCQSNRFVDNSSNAFTITVNGTPSVQAFSPFAPTAAYSAATNGGSGYFDGTGDYLSYSGVAPGTGAFTLECWFYNTGNFSGNKYLFGSAVLSGALGFRITSATSVESIRYNVATTAFTVPTMALNAWNHIVLVRDGSGNETVFLNGVRSSTGIQTDTYNYGATSIVGALNGTDGLNFTGYISGAVVATTALYSPSSTTITVPTAPPSPTGTALCLNFTNAGITDATGKNALETVGNAQISTTQSKFGGSSLAFDGTTDCLFEPSNVNYGYGTGDFTIEFWLRLNAVTTQTIVSNLSSATGTQPHIYYKSGTGAGIKYFTGVSGTGADRIDGGTLSINQWYHIAICRASGTTRMFIDGTQVGSSYTDANNYGTSNPLCVGDYVVSGAPTGTSTLNGFIDDLRISKFARYTGNFTVPQAQFAYNTADINVKQWVPNNFSVTAGAGNDSLVDSPTNYGTDTGAGGEVRGNYCVLNAAVNQTQFNLNSPASTGGTLSNGALQALGQASNWNTWIGTIGVTSGKWYWEITEDAEPSSFATIIGITNVAKVTTYTVTASSFAAGDTMGFALDLDAGTFAWYKNGVFQATLGTGITGEWYPVVALANSNQVTCNFGQRPFAYTAPSGFKALCTQNLPTPAIGASAIALANKNMNVVTYTGDGTNNRSITGVGFQPDLVWIKSRSNVYDHQLVDAVRGAGKELYSNLTNAESTLNTVPAFVSDGFQVNGGTYAGTNGNGSTFVGWSWKAGGAGVSNTAGSITSTVSANTAAGISVVTYTGNGSTTGATVGHGLGVAPRLIIVKNRGRADDWLVQHASTGATGYLNLNGAGAFVSSARPWNNTAPTSSVFTVNTFAAENWTNRSADTYVAYCFAEVAGFSKFGSYTGNGSADGVFVYLGFRPRWVMIRRTDAIDDWLVFDTARDTYNASGLRLFPRQAVAEEDGRSANPLDILSNGFKTRSTNPNASGANYIYAAFAEAPFNYARAR